MATSNNQTTNTSKVIKGMSSQTIVTIGLGLVEVVSFSIMSRLLSQQDFGYFAAITAITTVFASFSETGIGSAIVQRKDINSRYINNAFTLSFIFGAFISLLLLVLAKPLSMAVADQSMMMPLMLMSVTLLCNCLISVNGSILHRQLKFLTLGLIHLISLVITTVVAIILALKGFGYYAILAKAILASVLTLFLSWYFAKTRYHFALDKETFKSIFGFSGWLMASVFFRNLAQQIDRLLMTKLISLETLGAYNRPKDFIGVISNKIAGIFDSALFPVLSQIQDNKTSMKNAYLRSVYLLNVVSSLLAVAFVFNGELIIRIFFGTEWFNILGVFQVLSIAIIFSFAARLADCYLRSLGFTKQQFFFRIFEVVTKLLGLFVGYRWGIMGIAVSVLASDTLMVLVKHFYVASKIGISFGEGLSALLRSLQGSLMIAPLLLVVVFFRAHTVEWDILIVLLTCVLVVICFLIFPSLAGREYKNEYFPQIMGFVRSKLTISKNR